jgi:hypothetical protein
MALRHARFACVLSMASTLNSVGGGEGFGGGGLIIRGGRNVWDVARGAAVSYLLQKGLLWCLNCLAVFAKCVWGGFEQQLSGRHGGMCKSDEEDHKGT